MYKYIFYGFVMYSEKKFINKLDLFVWYNLVYDVKIKVFFSDVIKY